MNSELHILFIVPYSKNSFGIVQAAHRPEFSLGIGYLTSYCLQNGFRADYIDMEAEKVSISDLCSIIKKRKPAVVGITIVTLTMHIATEIIDIIKSIDKKILIIAGGPHPTALPEQTLVESNIDVIIRGEGEITCVKLLERHLSGKPFNGLPGITFRDGNKIISEGQAEFIANLDMLPYPYRKTEIINIYKNKIYFDNLNATLYNLISTRGCPYHCTFCGQSVIFNHKVRKRSAENIFSEIMAAYVKHRIKYFFFEDSTFVFSKDLVEKFCSLILKNGIKIKWGAMGRLDLVDKDFYTLMKKAGCKYLHFGVESGNDTILKSIKKMFTVDTARKSIEIIRNVGIPFNNSFVLGFPSDTKKTIRETINFAKELDSDYVSFSFATPYPGTELYNSAINNGWEIHNWKDYEESRYSTPIYTPSYITKDELIQLFNNAYREFYFRPKYILRHLKKIKNIRIFIKYFKICFAMLLNKS